MGLLDRIDFKAVGAEPPQSIEIGERNEFAITWPEARSLIPALRMRDACPCAGCIEEGSGRKMLDAASIPADIHAVEVRPVGSYAIQILWSDGHGTGIYSWDLLRRLSGLDAG